MLKFECVKPLSPHTHSIIWLHGLGADGHDFKGIVPELTLPPQHGVHFIFPHAPLQAVTINAGMQMPAWFDIYDLDTTARADFAGILRAAKEIEALIAMEKSVGIPSRNILLAGFSQGGVLALYCALTYAERLGGVLALSTYLPKIDSIIDKVSIIQKDIPILMAHGRYDSVIQIEWARAASVDLEQHGCPVEWHEFDMDHQVCFSELGAISKWLTRNFLNCA